MSLCSVQAYAGKSISVQTYRPKHPEFTWLRRFLRLQGYQPRSGHPSGRSLSLRLMAGSSVVIQESGYSKRYTIPKDVQSPRVRARMMTIYLGLFRSAVRSGRLQRMNSPEPGAVQTNKPASKPKKVKPTLKLLKSNPRKTNVSTKKVVRTTTIKAPKARVIQENKKKTGPAKRRKPSLRKVVKNRRRSPKKTVFAPVLKRMPSALRRSAPVKKSPPKNRKVAALPVKNMQKLAVPRPKALRKRPLPPAKRRANSVKKPTKRLVQKPPKNRKVAALPVLRKKSVKGEPIAIWGDVLSLDMGFSGGMRWSNFERFLGGGSLLVGFNAWRWTVRMDLGIHAFFLLNQKRNIFLMRPSFWFGWQVPTGRAERWFRLHLLLGLGSELFVKESEDAYSVTLRWGGMAGLQAHWWFARRWSLFFRPVLLIFPGGFGDGNTQDPSASPSVQLGALLGAQVRF